MSFERIVPGTNEWVAYHANHIQRYIFAEQLLRQLNLNNVLDAACGVGYGSYHLAKAGGMNVLGMDRSDEALQIASKQFAHPSVTYCKDDCHTLEVAEKHSPFQAVVSFETIEHIPHPKKFLARCHKLLSKTDGRLIISSPNASVTDPEGIRDWEYHEREYKAGEFVELLAEAGFELISLFGQRYTALGLLRNDVRADLNRLRFNPFVRLGAWGQKLLRGRRNDYPMLPEQVSDFEIVPLTSADDCEAKGKDGPFVIIGLLRPVSV